jgi:hypothetical protein
MKIILATVNRVRKGETFLESVNMEGPGAQPILIQLFQDRGHLLITYHKGISVYHNSELLDSIPAICDRIPKGKAAVGEIAVENGSLPFVAVPYAKDRLIYALIRSARAFRMVRKPVRLIENVSDLLNAYEPAPVDPRIKD